MSPFHLSPLVTTTLITLFSALVGGFIAKKLRVPAILGYIISGFAIGNLVPAFLDYSFLNMVGDTGVTLLLFTLGIEFSFQRLRKVLKTMTWAAILQMTLMMLLTYSLAVALGWSMYPALFLSIAVSLSSTVVVIKLLSEKGELDTIPGEVLTGWLIVQDLAVIPIMILLPTLLQLGGSETVTITHTFISLGASVALSVVTILSVLFFGKIGVPKALSFVASQGSRELFLIATVGFVFLCALLFWSVGLSSGLGAFLAGLLVAETSQNHAIFSEIRPLRDLFAVVFFVTLGMVLPIGAVVSQLGLIVLVAVGAILGKMILVYIPSRVLGYHRKTAFLVSLGLIPLSEFGCIIAKEALGRGVIDTNQYAFLIALTFITMVVGSVVLSHGHKLYYILQGQFGKRFPHLFATTKEDRLWGNDLPIEHHVVICGYGRVGKYVGRALEMTGIPFLVVDYNHTTVAQLKDKKIPVVYGDPADIDVLDFAQVDLAFAVVIAIPDRHTQEMVIGNVQTLNKSCKIICRTHHEEDQLRLKMLGVTTIVQPEFEAALAIIQKLVPSFGVSQDELIGKISRLKIEHGIV